MADDSYEFSISKFLEEQKHLLALERERFAVEKIKILEPEDVTVTPGSSPRDISKTSKDHINSKLVDRDLPEAIPESTDKENFPSNSDAGECPIEKLLREGNLPKADVRCRKSNPSSPAERGLQRKITKQQKQLDMPEVSSPKPEQQDEMEQWVSDTFYSYFPSFNKNQNEKKSMLSRARQADYQEYLKNIPEVTTKHQQYMEKYGTQAVQTSNLDEKGTNTVSKANANTSTDPITLNVPITTFEPTRPAADRTHQMPAAVSIKNNASSYLSPGSQQVTNPMMINKKSTQLLLGGDPTSSYVRKDTIDRRNRLLAEEESRRKLEYQKELIKQIEEKRKEVERLREKEKIEEEMLTSRLEQQLKTMQLEEELEREKQRSEKIRMANEQNHIRRLQLLSKLENDHKVFNPYDDQRKTLSENGKEVYMKPAAAAAASGAATAGHPSKDAKIYRYFSNSAQNPPASFASSSLSSEMEYDSSSESMDPRGGGGGGHDHRYQYCKNCRADIDRSFLPRGGYRGGHNHHHQQQQFHQRTPKSHRKVTMDEHQCLNCHKRIEKMCARCDRVVKRSSMKRNLCPFCQQAAENSRMQKEAQSELKKHRSKLLRSMELMDDDGDETEVPARQNAGSPTNPYKIIDIQYHESDNDHDLSVLNPVIVRNNYKKPYSLNIDKDSLFHPSKKTPEPKVSVNIRNGEVFVDNKLNSSHQHHRYHQDQDTDDVTTTDEMDDRIQKYVKHYNTLWMKRGITRKNNLAAMSQSVMMGSDAKNANTSTSTMTSSMVGTGGKRPLPSLSPPKVYVSDRPENLKSDAMKTTEKKWDIPAVERTKVSPGSPRVLTQLGAIRKQLQLEQLQMDQTYTKSQQRDSSQEQHQYSS